MWKVVLLLLTISTSFVFNATVVHCPNDSLKCDGQVLEETSFQFLNKLSNKEFRNIISLTISNASITKIDPKLKYLKNLQYLDLSYNTVKVSTLPSLPNLKTLKLNSNTLKDINLELFPRNIEELDLSNNLLEHIPIHWKTLRSLKTLHFYKNPIDCECTNYNVLRYQELLKHGINIPEPVECHSPKHVANKNIDAVNCSRADIMQYDEPAESMVEGSGFSDIFEDDTASSNVDHLNEEDVPDDNTIVDDKIATSDEENTFMVANDTQSSVEASEEEEGSGDEGSGFPSIVVEPVPACHINCSTPKPLVAEDEANVSPLPNLIKQIGIIRDDVIGGLRGDEVETQSSSSSTPTTTSAIPVEVTEPAIIKEAEPTLLQKSDKSESDVEVFNNETQPSETKGAFVINQNSSAVYIVVGICLLLTVVFIICLVKKRRNKRRNRREIPGGFGEEMKPLSKSPIEVISEKPNKNIPEHIPLINGQNGKKHIDDMPVLKSFTPLAHPEILEDEEEKPKGEPEVEMRDKPVPELLTPPRERVTVRASEIPDSIPKTPVLVHRQKNSDGEIVTTVVPP